MFDPNNVTHLIVKSEHEGDKRKRYIQIDPEDFIAIASAAIAVLFAVAVIGGWLPLNRYTTAIIGCSGAGVIIARIVKARGQKPRRH